MRAPPVSAKVEPTRVGRAGPGCPAKRSQAGLVENHASHPLQDLETVLIADTLTNKSCKDHNQDLGEDGAVQRSVC